MADEQSGYPQERVYDRTRDVVPVPSSDREGLVRAGASALGGSVRKLPEWMQKPALGRGMEPLAELVVDALRPLLAARERAAEQRGREAAAQAIEAARDSLQVLDCSPDVELQTALAAGRATLTNAARLARGGPSEGADRG